MQTQIQMADTVTRLIFTVRLHVMIHHPYIDWTIVTAFLPACRNASSYRCQNAASRLRGRDHVTSALQQLHWLPIHYRIQYKLCLLMYSVCQQHCPVYISNMVQSVANSTHRQGLRSSTYLTFVVPRTRTKLSERVFSVCGTHFQPLFVMLPTQNYLNGC